MTQPSELIDARTYNNELFALNLYLKRISTGHAVIRMVGNIAIVALIIAGFGGAHTGFLIGWGIAVVLLELASYLKVRQYFNKGASQLAEDGTINGRHVTTKLVRIVLYLNVVIPTAVITWAYAIPAFMMAGMDGPAPAIGTMVCVIILVNIAALHTYHTSLPLITISVPAVAFMMCLGSITDNANQMFYLGFGALMIINTISIAIAGVKTQKSLMKSKQDAEDEALARQDADNANRAKSQFLANMSHELRTPLNAIIGYSEMMLEDAENDGRKSDVDDHKRIILAGKRLLLNINDILDFSKIEAGRMEAEIGQFDLRQMIEDAADAIRPALSQKPVSLQIEFSETLPLIWSDRHKLEQCLLNLLSNAAKFTHEGEIRITGHAEKISGFSGFVLEVHDTGIGMTDEHLANIFKPFSQADNTFTRKYGGTGLGLVITQRLMKLLGGDLSVTSTDGKGSVFSLHFPIMSQLAQTSPSNLPPENNQDQPFIVIADDDLDVHELLSRDLRSLGFAIRHATTLTSAREAIASEHPSLVMLDLNFPDGSGLDLLKEIRSSENLERLPVIVHSVDSDRQPSLDAGASTHMTKPTPREDLIATVVRLAVQSRKPAQASAPSSTGDMASMRQSA